MSFKRKGTPEPLQPIKFKCLVCGSDAVELIAGHCPVCAAVLDITPDPGKMKKTKTKKPKNTEA